MKETNSKDTNSLSSGQQYALENDHNNSNSNSDNNTELIERVQLLNTPFHVVGNKDTGYMLTLGRYKITDIVPTRVEAIELLATEQWNIITRVVTTLHEAILSEFKNNPSIGTDQ